MTFPTSDSFAPAFDAGSIAGFLGLSATTPSSLASMLGARSAVESLGLSSTTPSSLASILSARSAVESLGLSSTTPSSLASIFSARSAVESLGLNSTTPSSLASMLGASASVLAVGVTPAVGFPIFDEHNPGTREAASFTAPFLDHAAVVGLLSALDVDLPQMWFGAASASVRRNPDWVRHVAASLRELLMHVLRYLAPDQSVLPWTQDSKEIVRGRPTRAARLRFIFERNRCDPLGTASAEARTFLRHLDALSGYTHRLSVSLTEAELKELFSVTSQLLTRLMQGRQAN